MPEIKSLIGRKFNRWTVINGPYSSRYPLIVGNKQPLIFIKVIPCPRLNVVSKAFDQTPNTGSHVNNFGLLEATNNSIFNTKHLRASLFKYVRPENTFFFWGESLESLNSSFLVSGNCPLSRNGALDLKYIVGDQESTRENKRNADPIAIIIYKCCDTKCIQPYYWRKKCKSRSNSDRQNVAGLQFKDFCPLADVHKHLTNHIGD